MRRPNGYAQVFGGDGTEVRFSPKGQPTYVRAGMAEFDTCMCGHCGAHFHVKASQKPEDIGGFCRQCMKAICVKCLVTGRCDPLEKKLERAEARHEALRSYGVI